jgi:hypothetical protein
VKFETLGIPSVVIVTDTLLSRAKLLLTILGGVQIPVLVTPNPIVYLKGQEIQKRAEQLLPMIYQSLTVQGQEVVSR